MRRLMMMAAVACLLQTAAWGQKKYEMVIEKTDGTEVVMDVEDVVAVHFREKGDGGGGSQGGDSDEAVAAKLVGVWGHYYPDGGGYYIGIQFGSGGEHFGYDEWNAEEGISDFSNMRVNLSWSVADGRIYVTYGGESESWAYTLSDDGQTLTLSDHQGFDYHGADLVNFSPFTKLK